MIVGKTEYLDKIENLVNDIRKFEKNNLENDVCFSFAINQEKQVDNIFKKIIVSDDIFKSVDTRPDIIYGICKVHSSQIPLLILFTIQNFWNRILNFLWEANMLILFLLTSHLKRLMKFAPIQYLRILKE